MDHPIWAILEHQGRTIRWLARRTGYSEDLLSFIKTGRRNATPEFRARCADKLDLPESVLFHGAPTDSRPEEDPEPGSDHRASTAVARAYDETEEAPIGIPA